MTAVHPGTLPLRLPEDRIKPAPRNLLELYRTAFAANVAQCHCQAVLNQVVAICPYTFTPDLHIWPRVEALIRAQSYGMENVLQERSYKELDATKAILAECRRNIVSTRLKLASNNDLAAEELAELWQIVESREWFMKIVAENFYWQLEQIDRELEEVLRR